jgi:hypothetical protein
MVQLYGPCCKTALSLSIFNYTLIDVVGNWYKVDMSALVFQVKRTPIFELCTVGCESMIDHQK